MESIRDNTDRAAQAALVFKCVAVFYALVAVQDVVYASFLETTDMDNPEGTALLVLATQGLMGLLQIVAVIGSAVYFIRWFRRAYANLGRAGLQTEHSEGWAAGAWFVPFMNLVRPYTIMREIWRGNQQLAGTGIRPHTLLKWWWAAYLAHSTVANITGRMTFSAETNLEQINATWADFCSSLFDIVSAVLSVLVIQRVQQLAENAELHHLVNRLGAPAPAPQAQEFSPTEEDMYL